jgi:predicted HicB family RNase H-like nuclease
VQKYSAVVSWSEHDHEYVAASPEIPGLSGMGFTAAAAIEELSRAVEAAVAAYEEDHEPVPVPQLLPQYSGQFRLRLPKSLHASLAMRASAEGVSINSLALQFISSGVAHAAEADLHEQCLALLTRFDWRDAGHNIPVSHRWLTHKYDPEKDFANLHEFGLKSLSRSRRQPRLPNTSFEPRQMVELTPDHRAHALPMEALK